MASAGGLLARVRRLPPAVRLLIACILCLLIGVLLVGGILWLDAASP